MTNPLRVVGYAAWVAKEILVGALGIAKDAVTPGVAMDPAIVELPLRCHTDLEVSLMASSITITPGTVTLGVAPGDAEHPPTLFVHAIYGSDPDEVLEGLREMEDRLLTVTRGRAPERSPR